MGSNGDFPILIDLFLGSSRSCEGAREKIGIGVREPFFFCICFWFGALFYPSWPLWPTD